MSRVIAGVATLMLAAVFATMVHDDFRSAQSRTLFFGRVSPLVFSRRDDPAFFWGSTAINVAVVIAVILGGFLVLAGLGAKA